MAVERIMVPKQRQVAAMFATRPITEVLAILGVPEVLNVLALPEEAKGTTTDATVKRKSSPKRAALRNCKRTNYTNLAANVPQLCVGARRH
jgi:hypothetical protein